MDIYWHWLISFSLGTSFGQVTSYLLRKRFERAAYAQGRLDGYMAFAEKPRIQK